MTFCFGIWHIFNSFSVKVRIHATCCSHRTEIAPKKVIFYRWEQSPSRWRDFTSTKKKGVYNKVTDILVQRDGRMDFVNMELM